MWSNCIDKDASQKKKVQGKPDIHLIKNEVATQSTYKHQLKIDSRNNVTSESMKL